MVTIETASLIHHSQEELDKLYQIVIKGYELTEAEIWGPKYVRVFRHDYDELIKKGEILLAKYNGDIAGGIHTYQLNSQVYTFSLLASNFNLGGKGIGTALINAAEKQAINAGAQVIQMEVLRVKGLDTDSKLRLDSFYKRLGYRFSHSEDCISKIPIHKYKKLKAPSNFDFYKKHLKLEKHPL